MKNFIWILAGTVILPQTFLFAADSMLDAKINARVTAMKEARSAARNTARGESRRASVRPVVSPRPTVNTATTPPIIKAVEIKPEVVALKDTTKQTRNEIAVLKHELQKATTPAQKADLENKLKVHNEKLKADNTAFKRTLSEEVRKEVRRASKKTGR